MSLDLIKVIMQKNKQQQLELQNKKKSAQDIPKIKNFEEATQKPNGKNSQKKDKALYKRGSKTQRNSVPDEGSVFFQSSSVIHPPSHKKQASSIPAFMQNSGQPSSSSQLTNEFLLTSVMKNGLNSDKAVVSKAL